MHVLDELKDFHCKHCFLSKVIPYKIGALDLLFLLDGKLFKIKKNHVKKMFVCLASLLKLLPPDSLVNGDRLKIFIGLESQVKASPLESSSSICESFYIMFA